MRRAVGQQILTLRVQPCLPADRSISQGALEQGLNVCFQSPWQSAVLDPVWESLGVKALVQCQFQFKADQTREKRHTFKGFSKTWLP